MAKQQLFGTTLLLYVLKSILSSCLEKSVAEELTFEESSGVLLVHREQNTGSLSIIREYGVLVSDL